MSERDYDEHDITMADEKQTQLFKCPGCGAQLHYTPGTSKLGCHHCGTEVDFTASADVKPVDYATGERPEYNWGSEAVVYRCDNCGAKEIVNSTDIAKKCPFCFATNVLLTDELPGIKPGAVVPFLFDEEKAKQNFVQWIKKRWFIPNKLKSGARTAELSGVYSPSWIYDSGSHSVYAGRVGVYYTVTVGSGKNRRTERRIRWRNISGNYARDFNDIIIESSPHLTQRQLERLRPFRLDKIAAYDKRFLAGFSAAHYDRDVDACWLDARKDMDGMIRSGILSQHRHDVVAYLNVSTHYIDVKYRYVLLPVWMSNYRYNNKAYSFIVNGSTGKITGQVPRSALKIIGFIGLIILLLGALFAVLWLTGAFDEVSNAVYGAMQLADKL